MLIGGLMIHGLQPGPRLFSTSTDVVYGILAAVAIANVLMLVISLVGYRYFVRVLKVPRYLLAPALLLLTVIGAYALNNSWFDVGVMLVLGAFGYLLTIAGFPVYPIVLGLVLGPILESESRRALVMAGGDWTVFLTRPVSLAFLCLAVLVLVGPWALGKIRGLRSAHTTDMA